MFFVTNCKATMRVIMEKVYSIVFIRHKIGKALNKRLLFLKKTRGNTELRTDGVDEVNTAQNP